MTKEKTKAGAGKGDSPRNISDKFRSNFDEIDWKKVERPRGLLKHIAMLDDYEFQDATNGELKDK